MVRKALCPQIAASFWDFRVRRVGLGEVPNVGTETPGLGAEGGCQWKGPPGMVKPRGPVGPFCRVDSTPDTKARGSARWATNS